MAELATKEYDLHKVNVARRRREVTAAGQEIGPCEYDGQVDAERVERASKDFKFFCETYYLHLFYLGWSDAHLEAIADIERIVLKGGMLALAMPRGYGKTTLCRVAVQWAILAGLHKFVYLISANKEEAVDNLESIVAQFEVNDKLVPDFWKAVWPIRMLEGESRRCNGQRLDGQQTNITMTRNKLVLPTVDGSLSSGAVIKVAGITGGYRGANETDRDGNQLRPSLVICDDPQTDESAASSSQTRTRYKLLTGAIKGLKSVDDSISILVPCTVITPGDLSDRILDEKKSPEFHGKKTKRVEQFPDNQKLWDEYGGLYLSQQLKSKSGDKPATDFYLANREAMDKGAKVSWSEGYEKDKAVSAIEYAMQLKFENEDVFWAEHQNTPLADDEKDPEVAIMTADEVAEKTNNTPKLSVPEKCDNITAYIDVHDTLLYYAVCAFEPSFSWYVIDYGVFPDQGRSYFSMRNAVRTLQQINPGKGVDGSIYSGLSDLTHYILGREYTRTDGSAMHVDKCLIDQGYKADLIHQFCRQSSYASLLRPAKGFGITAANKPITEYDKKRGDLIGHHWWIPANTAGRALRHVAIDTNYWKSFVHQCLKTAMGDAKCLSLFGGKPGRHRLLAEHLAAEFRIRTEGRGRKVDEWKLPPSKPDNHWFDCITGCGAAASMVGVQVVRQPVGVRRVRKRRVRQLA